MIFQSMPKLALLGQRERGERFCGDRNKTRKSLEELKALARQSKFALVVMFNPYRIFRASQSANRWRIINQMFAKSMPLDARVKKYH